MIATLTALIAAAGKVVVPAPPPVDPVAAEILRMGVESATEIAFTVEPDGKAAGCVVEKTSGSDTLDAEACTILMARGKWSPQATSAGDKPVPRVYRTRVVWRIED